MATVNDSKAKALHKDRLYTLSLREEQRNKEQQLDLFSKEGSNVT